MDPRVRSLITQLSVARGKKVVSYGKELEITEEQVKKLVSLNFVFEGRITQALALIEQGLVSAYTFKNVQVYKTGGELVYTGMNMCTCLESWCKHLLAVELVTAGLLGITTIKELSPQEFVDLVYKCDGKTGALV